MSQKTKQAKTYVQRFNDLTNEMMENAVTKSEIKEVMDVFVGKYKELTQLLNDKMAENKAEMSMETARLGKQVSEFEARLRQLMDTSRREHSEEVDTKLNELSATVGYVESLIEYYDDSELRTLIEEVRQAIPTIPEIPEAFDPSEITEELQTHKKELKRLAGSISVPSPVHWPRHESFTMNGSDTTVTLTQAVGAAGTAIFGVRYMGQMLDLGDQYTVDGNKLTFDFTPVNGSTISVSYFG